MLLCERVELIFRKWRVTHVRIIRYFIDRGRELPRILGLAVGEPRQLARRRIDLRSG